MLRITTLLLALSAFIACTNSSTAEGEVDMMQEKELGAIVTSVETNGSDNSYTFNVTIASPDTGCEQYADWWEVVSEDGSLIYRRALGHSHVNEQPFTRSGGLVTISQQQTVMVRAHMNNIGYITQSMRGNVGNGFQEYKLEENFASELETAAPQPGTCAF